jgi:hypothetical protein
MPYSQANCQCLFHQVASSSFFQLNFTLIIGLNFVKFKFHSMYLNSVLNFNSIQFELPVMPSIFSFKWNLIFTKSIHFFHQLINLLSLVVHSNVPKNVLFYTYIGKCKRFTFTLTCPYANVFGKAKFKWLSFEK